MGNETSLKRICRKVAIGEGEARWWFGGLAIIKLRGENTAGHFSLLEMLYPSGYEVPLHVHHHMEELAVNFGSVEDSHE